MSAAVLLPRAEAPVLGGRYVLGETVAIGGGATIALAQDTRLDRVVAIKRPRADRLSADDAGVAARFAHEAAMLARCPHPGVVTCLDRGEDEDGPYLVLEWIAGGNLVQRLAAGPVTLDVAVAWAVQVSRAVAALHRRGIAHGDLKPQHVVIRSDGRAALVDFDRAHDLASIDAPELARGDRLALGTTLRWLLERAGAPPAALRIIAPLRADAAQPTVAEVAATLEREYARAQ